MPTTDLPEKMGNYIVKDELGRGTFATVYLADDVKLQRHVAIKVLHTHERANARELIIKEAQAAAGLSHTGIVSIHGVEQMTDGTPFVVMPYLSQGTLAARMIGETFSLTEITQLIMDVAKALSYAHDKGVIHRDIKPTNILFNDQNRPVIADFGLAISESEMLTRDYHHIPAGTLEFMAPEYFMGASVDRRADIYSLGVVLYEMLTNRRPIEYDDNHKTFLARVVGNERRPAVFYKPWIPTELSAICDNCLKREPRDRYQSAEHLADALSRFMKPDHVTGVGRSTTRFRRSVTHLAAGCLIAAILALIVSSYVKFQPTAPTTPTSDPDLVVSEHNTFQLKAGPVALGLNWLAQHQNPDGSWSFHNFHFNCLEHTLCPDRGRLNSDAAATGLALAPFLSGGFTFASPVTTDSIEHRQYRSAVANGLRWLIEHQSSNGELSGTNGNRDFYGHCIATVVLCDAYAMMGDDSLKDPAQRAIRFILDRQDPDTGGWAATSDDDPNTVVFGCAMEALLTGRIAGLAISQPTFHSAIHWLDSVEGNRPIGGVFGFEDDNVTPAMTAIGLLCLQHLGTGRNHPRMRNGVTYLMENLPDPSSNTPYYWYYGTRVMVNIEGEEYKTWYGRVIDVLQATQITNGRLTGSWNPRDQWDRQGGRIYATALRLLILEPYRYLPLYDVIDYRASDDRLHPPH